MRDIALRSRLSGPRGTVAEAGETFFQQWDCLELVTDTSGGALLVFRRDETPDCFILLNNYFLTRICFYAGRTKGELLQMIKYNQPMTICPTAVCGTSDTDCPFYPILEEMLADHANGAYLPE